MKYTLLYTKDYIIYFNLFTSTFSISSDFFAGLIANILLSFSVTSELNGACVVAVLLEPILKGKVCDKGPAGLELLLM